MKAISKRLLCIMLSVFLLLTALPLTVSAATVINVGTAEELTAACTEINQSGGEFTINLTADIPRGYIGITNSTAEVTVYGNNHTIDGSQVQGGIIYVSNGATVNLGSSDGGEKNKLTVVGGESNDNPGIVYVLANSDCNMYDGVTLKDHQGQNYYGGGVTVEGGTFHMYGGTIQNCGINGGSVCYGGGVGVFAAGNFIMDGGTITGCYATSDYIDDYDPNRSFVGLGGGVFVTAGSDFTMNGGTISNCEATNFGGGVAMVMSDSYSSSEWQTYGMGNPKSNVTINGGKITGNEADCGAGVFVSGYFYAFSGAFGWTLPTGVSVNPGLFINGGEISANEAADMGGGVLVAMLRPAAKVQIHNAEIKNNSADNGAGIENYGYWTQMDIDGCMITGNSAITNGGGILLTTNSSNGYTNLKNSTVTGNTSGDRGAGVYYDANSRLNISGANTIQNNTYNGALNNLNILSLSKPVYVSGDLTGSKIGLSDPTLWNDGKEDTDPEAVSTNYLTSGYKTYNSVNPGTLFTSDHESWIADFSDVNEDEVRLIRKITVDFHINNDAIASEFYNDNDLFTEYVNESAHTVEIGDTIQAFYLIPAHTTSYIFKGWYYDQNNEDDDSPVRFGTDTYTAGKDIYAHWITVEDVDQDEDDPYTLPAGDTAYGGYDLSGVQIRRQMQDTNFNNNITPGGMRYITSLSMDVVDEINDIKPYNIEYGYVAATSENWIEYHRKGVNEKLQYVSATANGINTTNTTEKDEDYFGFAKNINCTSQQTNPEYGVVENDHYNFSKYLLYSLVITYENEGDEAYDKKVLARPYIKYEDANGLERVAYSEYRGASNVIGGCYTSYNATIEAIGG